MASAHGRPNSRYPAGKGSRCHPTHWFGAEYLRDELEGYRTARFQHRPVGCLGAVCAAPGKSSDAQADGLKERVRAAKRSAPGPGEVAYHTLRKSIRKVNPLVTETV